MSSPSLSFSQITAAAAAILPSLPLYVEGPPGVGKTSLAYSVATSLGISAERVLLIRPAFLQPSDLLGLPYPSTDGTTTSFLPPQDLARFAANPELKLILIDELPQAAPLVQHSLAALLGPDHRLGSLQFDPANTYFMATGNAQSDGAGVRQLFTHLGNRLSILSLAVSFDDWLAWARNHNISPHVVGYLSFQRSSLWDFDAKRPTNATPRAWERISDIVQRPAFSSLSSAVQFATIASIVGEGPGAAFAGFLSGLSRVVESYHIDRIRQDPENHPVPASSDLQTAYMIAVYLAQVHSPPPGDTTTEMKKQRIQSVNQIWPFVQRLPIESAILCFQMLMDSKALSITDGAYCPHIGCWIQHNIQPLTSII